MTERLHFHFSLSCIGEGNGNPLQCSCLENPRDGGAWWAAIYGVAQSRTRLKRLRAAAAASTFSSVLMGTTTFSCRVFGRNLETVYIQCPRRGLAHSGLLGNGDIILPFKDRVPGSLLSLLKGPAQGSSGFWEY